jgi:hypothetical protein
MLLLLLLLLLWALKILVAVFGNRLHTHLSGSSLRQEGAPVDLLDCL